MSKRPATASEAWVTPIETMLRNHRWDGGYFCGCGAEMNSPQTWSRHVLTAAYQSFVRRGIDAASAQPSDPLRRVRALHACLDLVYADGSPATPMCDHCRTDWPCATAVALDVDEREDRR